MQQREKISSRLGFILLSAGCDIGLGNVWKFPFITGQYGGAIFVLIYLVFLVIFGMPIMAMEFAVGRASRKSASRAFHELEPKGSKWHVFSWAAMAGNYLLMMFYTTVSGWILAYLVFSVQGKFVGLNAGELVEAFGTLTKNTGDSAIWMILICLIGFGICAIGLQKGVEFITKIMMSALFIVLIILAVHSITLPGAVAGLEFYLKPSLEPIREYGIWTVIFAAMGQSFFTLSVGIGDDMNMAVRAGIQMTPELELIMNEAMEAATNALGHAAGNKTDTQSEDGKDEPPAETANIARFKTSK